MGSGLVFCLFFIAKTDGMSIKIKRQKTRPDPIALKKGYTLWQIRGSSCLKEEINLKIKQFKIKQKC
jgi:hypothetical protein